MSDLYHTRRTDLQNRLQLEEGTIDTFLADSLKYFEKRQQQALCYYLGHADEETLVYADIAARCGLSSPSSAHTMCKGILRFLEEIRKEQQQKLPNDVLQQTAGQFCSIVRTYTALGTTMEWHTIKRLAKLLNDLYGDLSQGEPREIRMGELLTAFSKSDLKMKSGFKGRNLLVFEQLLKTVPLRLRD
jgi:hypothetical protein